MEITNVEVLQENKTVKAKLTGRMTSEMENRIYRNFIAEHLEAGIHNIILDLSELDFMNSSAIGVIMISLKSITSSGGQIFAFKPHENIRDIMEITRLNRKIKICKSEEEIQLHLNGATA